MPEIFINNASTTLVQSAAIGDLTIKVNSNIGFSSTGNFRLKIDSEQLLCTQVGLTAPPTPPVVTAVVASTGYHTGTFTVAYTYVTAGGETSLSATANVSVTATQAIQVAAITGIPSYVTAVKFYFTAAPSGDTPGFVVSVVPSLGVVPTGNLTAEGNGVNAPGSSPSTVWVVTRGVESTTAAPHSNGAPVVQNLTTGALAAFLRSDGGANSQASSSGAPTTGTYTKGATYLDSNGALFSCITAGSPGSWAGMGWMHWSSYVVGPGGSIDTSSNPGGNIPVPAGFRHAMIIVSNAVDTTANTTGSFGGLQMGIAGGVTDSGFNYIWTDKDVFTNTSGTSAEAILGSPNGADIAWSALSLTGGGTGSWPSSSVIWFPDYSNPNTHRTAFWDILQVNSSTVVRRMGGGYYVGPAGALTLIHFFARTALMAANTTFDLCVMP